MNLVRMACCAMMTLSLFAAGQGPSPNAIKLPSRILVPPAAVPADLAERARRAIQAEGLDRAHLLVQLTGPAEKRDRDRLAAAGIRLLTPLDRRTWYASVTSAGVAAMRTAPGVRWADLIAGPDKRSPLIKPQPDPWQVRPGGRVAYSVLFHKDVRAAEVSALAQRLGARTEEFESRTFPVVRTATFAIAPASLEQLAAADIVQWVEPLSPPMADDNLVHTQPLSNVDDVQGAPFNLNGSGINVGIWEAGDTIRATHVDLTPRVIVEAGQSATQDDHAANVAGTVGASGVNIPNAEGMAPQVMISSWDAASDTTEMTNAANSPGGMGDPLKIRISNHSYGPTLGWNLLTFNNNQVNFGLYTNRSVAFDNVVSQTGLIVAKSAGNDRDDDGPGMPVPGQPRDCEQNNLGVDADCISPEGVAKNVITVGAMDGGAAIGNFSSFGPTDDGRIKPDVMAQGVGVFSLGSDSDNDTSSFTGTSQATPAVSGITALLLQEAAKRKVTITPQGAKALLIQTARDVAGIGQATVGPDYATGWGIADAERAVNLIRQGGLREGTVADTGLGNAWTATFFVPAGLPEMHITVAWTDPAGNPGNQILINDLDLRLIAPDATVFQPWTLNPLSPGTAAVRNGGNDALNNVEQVSVLTPMAGTWTVRVSADPGKLPQAPQSFAVAGVLPPSDLVLVMDRSGSMNAASGNPGQTKVEALRTSANELVDLLDLGGGHALGLVQFASTPIAFVPPFDLQPLNGGNLPNAHTAISGITAGGNTNIISGVDAAIAQLSGAPMPSPRQAIVVFSDGKHNTPPASDLNSIGPSVQAGNFRFYSIGYGTDVDDAILSNVAEASGGIHVNEQDLSPIQLTKYFLTVGALVHDLSILSDPSFQVGTGKTASLSTTATSSDGSLYFAVNWSGKARTVAVRVVGPRPCKIPTSGHAGYAVRAGITYRLIRVDLPYRCAENGTLLRAGRWTVEATPTFRGGGTELVDITILGDSRVRLDARVRFDKEKRQYVVLAELTGDAKQLPIDKVDATAFLVSPLPDTKDSAQQDRTGQGSRPDATAREKRTQTLRLAQAGGDDTLTATIDAASLAPGLHQVRVVVEAGLRGDVVRRESTVSFYVPK